MSSKRVLIITYYWPPSGGSGVQRWLKFAKYLDREGWEVFVLTPENPSFTISDPSLLADVPANAEVWKLPIWEPYNAFHKISGLFGKKKVGASDMISTGNRSLFQKASSWIRGNLFIPDPRVFWVKPAVSFVNGMLQTNGIDKIITTGPPHSIHLIGLKLKKKHPDIKWIADFRDPWSEWDLLDTLSLTSFARARHKKLEREVLKRADRVVTIAPYHVRLFEKLGDRKVDLITNGFDSDDFAAVARHKTSKFTIRHTGIVDELRDPRPFMLSLKAACVSMPGMKENLVVEFIGNVNQSFQDWVKQDDVLSAVTKFVGVVPHKELLKKYGATDLLLLLLAHSAIAPGNLPGKFFEYLASGIPILAIGPVDGDAGDVIRTAKAGAIFERTDERSLTEALRHHYQLWSEGKMISTTDASPFTRKKLTDELIGILQSL